MVEVHVAAVADVVSAGSAADRRAFEQAETVYLPTRTVPMLGQRLEAAATLTEDADRATLRVRIALSDDAQITGIVVDRARVAAGRCLALDHAGASAAGADPDHRLYPVMSGAETLAKLLYARRLDRGSLAFYDLAGGWAAAEDGAVVQIPTAHGVRPTSWCRG